MRSTVLLLCALGAGLPAHAAVFCVSNGPEFQAAIHTARLNNQADEIRLRQGVYQRASGTAFVLNFEDGQDMLLSGGWSGANAGCTQLSNDPRLTVIDALGTGQGLDVSLGQGSPDITIVNLSFVDGRPDPNINFDSGTGLGIGVPPGNSSQVLIERCVFEGNEADSGSGLAVGVGGLLTVRNSLFVGNSSSGNGAAASLTSQTGVRFSNNTATGNYDAAAFDNGAVEIYGPGAHLLSNNVLFGNPGPSGMADLRLETPALLVANIVGVTSGTADGASIANSGADPRFVGGGDYRLRADSPARDAGALPLGGPGAFDAFGLSRVQGAAIDLGAHEYAVLFRHGFE